MYSIYLWSLILQDLIIGVHLQKLRSKMWCPYVQPDQGCPTDFTDFKKFIGQLPLSHNYQICRWTTIQEQPLTTFFCHSSPGKSDRILRQTWAESCSEYQPVFTTFMHVFSQVIVYTLGCLPITICIFYFIYGLATIGCGHLGWRTPIGHAMPMEGCYRLIRPATSLELSLWPYEQKGGHP